MATVGERVVRLLLIVFAGVSFRIVADNVVGKESRQLQFIPYLQAPVFYTIPHDETFPRESTASEAKPKTHLTPEERQYFGITNIYQKGNCPACPPGNNTCAPCPPTKSTCSECPPTNSTCKACPPEKVCPGFPSLKKYSVNGCPPTEMIDDFGSVDATLIVTGTEPHACAFNVTVPSSNNTVKIDCLVMDAFLVDSGQITQTYLSSNWTDGLSSSGTNVGVYSFNTTTNTALITTWTTIPPGSMVRFHCLWQAI